MSKIKFSLFCIVLIISLFCLTGCNDDITQNIENFYYVIAIGVDKFDSNNIELTIQIATTESSESSDSAQSSSSSIYTIQCNNINSGISILNNYLSKKLNFSHCSAVILSEEISKSGIKDYINILINNSNVNPNCNVIISSETAKKAIECVGNSNENFSAKLYEFIINSIDYTGYSIDATLNDFFYKLNFDSSTCVGTYAKISDDIVQNTGIAIFNDDKYIANLEVLDSICYLLLTNKLKTCTISINNPISENDVLDISLKLKKDTKIDSNIVNNYPYIKINSFLEYSIESSTNSFNTKSIEDVEILEKYVNNYLEELIKNFLYTISHVYNTDICNFENYLSSKYLSEDDFKKIHWSDIYKDSFFEVKVNGMISNGGLFSED